MHVKTSFSGRDNGSLDLSNPPSSGSEVMKPGEVNVSVPLKDLVSLRNTVEEIAEGLEKLAGRKGLQGWNYGYWLDRAYPDSWRALRKLNELCERCKQ